MSTIYSILIFSVAVFAVAKMLPNIELKGFVTAIWVSIVFSILSVLIGWLIGIIAIPFLLLPFGLHKFVVNTILLWLTDKIIDGIEIKGFSTLLLASLLISIIDYILSIFIH